MPEARTLLRPGGRRFLLGSPEGELPPGELFAAVDESDTEHLRSLEDLGFGRERRELELVLPNVPVAPLRPAVYLVATCDGEAVGICRVWVRPEHPRLGFSGIRRSLRRRGIARWLIGEVFAALHARGEREISTEVDETNLASRTLLEGLGGRVVGASLELRRRSGTSSQPEPARRRAADAPRSRT